MKTIITNALTTARNISAKAIETVRPANKNDWKFVGIGAGAVVGSLLLKAVAGKVVRRFKK